MFAVIEVHPDHPDQAWFYDGAGWTNLPTYYFSTEAAAARHAAESARERQDVAFAVVQKPTHH